MQPLDVAVFGPLKKGWQKSVKEYERHNPDAILTQKSFAKVFLPSYYQYVTADNIIAGFQKCGLMLFNENRPDYTKLEAAAAQKEMTTTIFEGVDQGE